MTVDPIETTLCKVISDALRSASNSPELSAPVTIKSAMGSPREWDSLSFVSVFYAVGEAFEVELDDDDAVHFQSAQTIRDFLAEFMSE